jgi:hypothetical protein
MKKSIFGLLAFGAVVAVLATGCVHTQTDTHAFAITWGKDTLGGRYQRTPEQVYAAAVTVIQNNGVLVQEYVPHDSTNTIRSFQAKVNARNVWIRVASVDPTTTEVDVQARTKWGTRDIDLIHELEKEIAIQLTTLR